MLPCLEAGRAAQQRHRRVHLDLVHVRQGRLQEPREERRHDLPGHHVTYPVSGTKVSFSKLRNSSMTATSRHCLVAVQAVRAHDAGDRAARLGAAARRHPRLRPLRLLGVPHPPRAAARRQPEDAPRDRPGTEDHCPGNHLLPAQTLSHYFRDFTKCGEEGSIKLTSIYHFYFTS